MNVDYFRYLELAGNFFNFRLCEIQFGAQCLLGEHGPLTKCPSLHNLTTKYTILSKKFCYKRISSSFISHHLRCEMQISSCSVLVEKNLDCHHSNMRYQFLIR